MKNEINVQQQIRYNSIPAQNLTFVNQLKVGDWNVVINILREQSNANAEYLTMLHKWLIGANNTDEIISIPEGMNFAQYVLTKFLLKDNTESVSLVSSDDITVRSATKVLLDAFNDITIHVGGSEIQVNSGTIYLKAPDVRTSNILYANDIRLNDPDAPSSIGILDNPFNEAYIRYIYSTGTSQLKKIYTDTILPLVTSETNAVGSSDNPFDEGHITNLYSTFVRTNNISAKAINPSDNEAYIGTTNSPFNEAHINELYSTDADITNLNSNNVYTTNIYAKSIIPSGFDAYVGTESDKFNSMHVKGLHADNINNTTMTWDPAYDFLLKTERNKLAGLPTREALDGMLLELREGIDGVNSGQNLADIVGTYADLGNYYTGYLQEGDKVQVLVDESQLDSPSTVYNWTGTEFSYIGPYGQDSYTKTAVNSMHAELRADVAASIATVQSNLDYHISAADARLDSQDARMDKHESDTSNMITEYKDEITRYVESIVADIPAQLNEIIGNE